MPAAIDPFPPVADASLPWDREIDDPVATLAAARDACGDTFVVAGPEYPTLFLFSAAGVRSFYELPEAEASKGVADWMMLRRKLPDELFDGRRTMPHELFGRDDVRTYLARARRRHRRGVRGDGRRRHDRRVRLRPPARSPDGPRVVGR